MTAAPPKLLPLQAVNIPRALRRQRRWAPWRAQWDAKKARYEKIPCDAAGVGISTVEAAPWMTFKDALEALESRPKVFAGIGYRLTDPHGIVAIDLDHCVDEAGNIAPWAAKIAHGSCGYVELSPSGHGMRVMVAGSVPQDWVDHSVGVEIYGGHAGRFVTMTGAKVNGSTADVQDAPPGFLEGLALDYPPTKKAKIELTDMPTLLDVVPVITELAPHALKFLAEGATGADRSRELFATAVALHSAGMSAQEVLTILASSEHAMQVALDHRRQDPDRALHYLWVEHASKAAAKAGPGVASVDDFDVEGVLPPKPAADDDDEDLLDARTLLSMLPKLPEAALYGPLADFAVAAAAVSEATVQSIYLSAIAHLGVAALAPFCVEISHERVPLSTSVVLVGPSSKARKGTAGSLVEHGLMPALRQLATRHRSMVEVEVQEHAEHVGEVERLERRIEARRAALALMEAGDQANPLDGLEEARSEVTNLQRAAAKVQADLPNHMDKPRGHAMRLERLDKLKGQLDQAHARLAPLEQLAVDKKAFADDPAAFRARVEAEIGGIRKEISAAGTMREPPGLGPLHQLAVRPNVMRGISSGEGIVEAICDPRVKPNGAAVGTDDKRLLIDVSEFGSVLSVLSREGNTGSANLRDAIDGRTIATTGRTDPATATSPHVALLGHVTGREFMRLAFGDGKSTEADNGLLNRMLFIFTAREKLVALPGKVPGVQAIAQRIWDNLATVFNYLRPSGETHGTPVEFDEEGRAEWVGQYEWLTRMQGESREATALTQRAEWHARRLAAKLALLNGEPRVSAPAVRAAVAIVRYALDSVNKIAASYKDRAKFARAREFGDRILTRLTTEPQHQRNVRRALNMSAEEFNAGLLYLIDVCSPALAVVDLVEKQRGFGPKPQRVAMLRRP